MHSSRMRTARSGSRLPGGGVSAPEGCLVGGGVCSQGGPGGVPGPGGSAPGVPGPGGDLLGGAGIPACT